MAEQTQKGSKELLKMQPQPSVAAITTHSSKINKQDSILESIYLSFGYKPPDKKELYQIICLGAMIIFFIISLAGFCVMWFTEFYNHSLVNSFLVLTENSSAADMWINPPVNNLLKVHIFNYTNIDSFLKGEDDKIRLEDLGPYTYEQLATKVNVKFNNNYTVTFNDYRKYKFRPDLSKGTEFDDIIVPNVPLLTAVDKISRMNFFMKIAGEASITLMGQNAFDFHNVHEFLWGYKDKIISFCKSFIYHDLPETFGMIQNRNGTSADTLQIYTGEDDLDKFGLVSQFNGMSKLNFWTSDECNRIDGSDSSQFPPHLMENREDLHVFTTAVCRKLPLRFSEEITILGDIDVWRYKAPLDVFSHPSINPNNMCYCQNNDISSCLPSGVFNGTLCYKGAPIFPSFPHFYAGDPSVYENLFEGIQPDAEQHQTYADIHPRLAFPIHGASRIQINVRLTKGNNLRVPLQKIKDGTYLPILWLEITVGEMSEDLKKTIYHSTFSAHVAQIILKYATLLILMITVSLIAITIHKLSRIRTSINRKDPSAEIEQLNKPHVSHC